MKRKKGLFFCIFRFFLCQNIKFQKKIIESTLKNCERFFEKHFEKLDQKSVSLNSFVKIQMLQQTRQIETLSKDQQLIQEEICSLQKRILSLETQRLRNNR